MQVVRKNGQLCLNLLLYKQDIQYEAKIYIHWPIRWMRWSDRGAYGVALGSQQIGTEVFHYVLSKKIGADGDLNPAKTKDMYDQEQKAAAAATANVNE